MTAVSMAVWGERPGLLLRARTLRRPVVPGAVRPPRRAAAVLRVLPAGPPRSPFLLFAPAGLPVPASLPSRPSVAGVSVAGVSVAGVLAPRALVPRATSPRATAPATAARPTPGGDLRLTVRGRRVVTLTAVFLAVAAGIVWSPGSAPGAPVVAAPVARAAGPEAALSSAARPVVARRAGPAVGDSGPGVAPGVPLG